MALTGSAWDVFVLHVVSTVEIVGRETIVRIRGGRRGRYKIYKRQTRVMEVRREEKAKREEVEMKNKYNNQQVWPRTTGTDMTRKRGFGKIKRQMQ